MNLPCTGPDNGQPRNPDSRIPTTSRGTLLTGRLREIGSPGSAAMGGITVHISPKVREPKTPYPSSPACTAHPARNPASVR